MNTNFVYKWQSQVKKGTLAFILLNLLKCNEYYGYELIGHLKAETKIDIAEGTLYPLLNRLKKEGLVHSKWVTQSSGIPRKYYQLTGSGIQTLHSMNSYWKGLEHSIEKITL